MKQTFRERKSIRMKKCLSIFLAVILLLTAAGCKNPDKPILRVAMSPDFAPMEFVDSSKTGQDRFIGFDVTLAKYLAKNLGMELQIVPMSFDACQDAVETGEVDLAISGFSWLPQRQERFNLSDTYRAGNNSDNQLLLVRADLSAALDSPAAFAGLRVGAQAASLQEWLVSGQLPDGVCVPFEDLDQGLSLLLQGEIDALAVAEGNAVAILAAQSDLAMAPFRFAVSEELTDNLILLQKGDTELTEAVNALLAKAEAAGYYPKWYAQALEQAGISVEEPATE
jgi:polar amino acid transport system substrate-binding protein